MNSQVMDTRDLASMQAQIASGVVDKADSRFVTDAASSQLWDQLAAEIQASQGQGYDVESVHEIP